MFKKLFDKFTGSKESADIEIVSKASPHCDSEWIISPVGRAAAQL